MSSSLTSLDFYYLAVSTNVFRYGYMVILFVGFIGNICQIITFSRKTMRRISTGILFLVLSVSDMIYLFVAIYVVYVYGFQQVDRSNMSISCRIRHFTTNFTSYFSAWILTTISCDRWIRSRFPLKAQQLCTPRHAALISLILALIDATLHVHHLTPLFGAWTVGAGGSCGANALYPSYVYFYKTLTPIIYIVAAVILPTSAMILFLSGTIINIRTQRIRINPSQTRDITVRETHRTRFIHRQMFILMIVTLILFFVTCLPVGLYRFVVATLNIQQPFTLVLLVTAIVGVIQTSTYALNFYLHCLTSKLFRSEFLRIFQFRQTTIRTLIIERTQPKRLESRF